MSEENNNIKNASEKLGKNPSLSKDFETWLAMDEERTHLNTQAQLADLMNSLEPEQNPPNRDGELLKNKPSPKTQTSSLPKKSISFSDTIETREKEDKEKSIFQGLAQSVSVPLGAIRDGILDTGNMFISPIRETQRTIAYLKKESSAHII